MKAGITLIVCGIVAMCTSCTAIKHANTHGLQDGSYVLKTQHSPPVRVYATISEDSLILYTRINHTEAINPVPVLSTGMDVLQLDAKPEPFSLIKTSIDLDLTTVLFKYRFNNSTLPNQLSSNLNFAFYCGYRHDYFKFRVVKDPLMNYKRQIRHFEFDMGVFAGLGSTPMNPSVTNDRISVEYDGIVFQKGVAFFAGSSNVTIGLGIGTDGLMDRNRKHWIYQEKPWIGVMIGLNLSD